MKKLGSILLVFCLIFLSGMLVACGKDKEKSKEPEKYTLTVNSATENTRVCAFGDFFADEEYYFASVVNPYSFPVAKEDNYSNDGVCFSRDRDYYLMIKNDSVEKVLVDGVDVSSEMQRYTYYDLIQIEYSLDNIYSYLADKPHEGGMINSFWQHGRLNPFEIEENESVTILKFTFNKSMTIDIVI